MRKTLCLASMLCLACHARAEKVWTEVRSPHFRVITDGSGRAARDVANDLEQMRHVFVLRLNSEQVDGGSPLTIIAANNEATFRELQPPFWKASGGNVAGEFYSGWEKRYAAIRLDTWQGTGQILVYNEYAHSMLHATTHWLPYWLDEGMSEFYAYTRFRPEGIYLGGPSLRLSALHNVPLLPVAEMLSMKDNSNLWRDNTKTQLFSAEAWAMVHYMFFGEGMNSGAKLQAFFQAIQNGTAHDKAFRDAFGDPRDFSIGLAEYLLHVTFKERVLPPDKGIDPRTFSERQLSPAETAYELGCFHLAAHHYAAGQASIQKSFELDPKLAATHEELGYLEFVAGHDEPARSQWQQAVAIDPTLYRSIFALTMSGPSFAEQTAAQLRETKVQLQHVTELAPKYAPAYVELALLEWRFGNMQQAYKDAGHAETLEPWRAGYHLVTGRILLNGNQPVLAANYARYVADHWSRSDHNEAVDLWEAIPPGQRGDGPPLARELPTGASVVQGQLSSLTCSETPGPKRFTVTLTPKDANANQPLVFSNEGNISIGFSDSLWWGRDHYSACHHLAGHPAVVVYKANAAGGADLLELEVRDDLPPSSLKPSATTAGVGPRKAIPTDAATAQQPKP